MAKRKDHTVDEFFEKFPKFREEWHAKGKFGGHYSARMRVVHVELEPDGLYRLDIVTTKACERYPYSVEAGKEWSYYFQPPADPVNERGTWGPVDFFRKEEPALQS